MKWPIWIGLGLADMDRGRRIGERVGDRTCPKRG